MNIFVVNQDPKIAAQQLCDKHVVKMITESAQMLSTAMWFVGLEGPYRIVHKNHPCTLWVQKSIKNYHWLWLHANELGYEYTRRYNKSHLAHEILLEKIPLNIKLPNVGLTPFPNCTPYKDIDIISAYKKYYQIDKAYFAKWKNNNVPEWFEVQ